MRVLLKIYKDGGNYSNQRQYETLCRYVGMLIFSLVLCHYYYTSTLCSASDLNNLFLYNAHNYFQMSRKSKNYATAPVKIWLMLWNGEQLIVNLKLQRNRKVKNLSMSLKKIILICLVPCCEHHYVFSVFSINKKV